MLGQRLAGFAVERVVGEFLEGGEGAAVEVEEGAAGGGVGEEAG